MRITLESTRQIVEINGVPCRVWEGTTASGVKVTAFVASVGVDVDDDASEFERELLETPQPRAREDWPGRMVFPSAGKARRN